MTLPSLNYFTIYIWNCNVLNGKVPNSAETIPIPEESQFLDCFGPFAGIGNGIRAKITIPHFRDR